MSKPNSGHFSGTTGAILAELNLNKENNFILRSSLDFQEHPIKNYSKTSINKIRSKVNSRTATKKRISKT